MFQKEYESGQLFELIESLFDQNYTKILSLETDVASWKRQRSCDFIFDNGRIVFANSQALDNEKFCKILGSKTNPNAVDAALLVTKQRVSNPQSWQEFVDLLIKMRIFTGEDVAKYISQSIAQNLGIFTVYPGKVKYKTVDSFDLFKENVPKIINWSAIKHSVDLRNEQWQRFKPEIPSMDAIPIIVPERLEKTADPRVKQHLANYVNGQRNLLDIAAKMGKDPLKVAKTYFNWCADGLINFEKVLTTNKSLPIVLSVDDSPIIQTMISRALSEICDVHLADKATTALEILDRLPVKMMLLDLTMPDVDGLEFCQKVRNIPKFKDLPIVMVTARDGLVNRAKGHFAGTNKYLTKPFKPEELRSIVNQYVR